MSIPKITVNFEDYQLGLVPPLFDAHAKIGVASAGPLTPQTFGRGADVATTYQGGPLAGALTVALIQTAPVTGVRVNTTIQGKASAVTFNGTGTGKLTVTGDPVDAASVLVTVTRPGTIADGNAAVVVTVNGVDGIERSVPANGVLDIATTGLTATFDAGTLVAGDTYALTTTAPAASVSDIATALDSLLQTRPALRYVHVLGAATPTLAAAVDAILTERETRNYYIHALLEARPMNDGETPSDYLTAITAQFANFTSTRVAIALDGGEIYNPLTRQLEKRNSAWKLTAQRGTRPIGESPTRTRTGTLPATGKLSFDANLMGTTGRFAALRTYDTRAGVYVAEWPMLAPEGSDFGEVQRREVIDRCATLGYDAALDYLGDDVPVDTTTGLILETAAQAFEDYVAGRIRAGVGANASGIRVTLNRAENILSTQHLEFTVSCIPLGYMKAITVNVGFLNPVLADPTSTATPVATPATTAAKTTTKGA